MNASPQRAYRPDIDGLRAIAVLLVLFDHVEIHRFAGGFIGVDVFFIISGYLIGAHILNDLDASTFSLARFYERRFRRIVPALLAVLLVTTWLAYHYLFPGELIGFGQSLVGALFSFSNIVFWQQSGYFDMPSRLKPLLHTWSLGVEEQFYIVLPLLLIVLARFARRHLAAILSAICAILFGLACYWTVHARNAAFFLAPLRAWELLLGTLLTFNLFPPLAQRWQRELAAATGLLLILIPALVYTETTPFPGPAALPPCIGTILILAAGAAGPSVVGRLLSTPPFRFIGLISYSLYLWHWPLQVFQTTNRILVPDRFPLWVSQLAVVAASLLAAAISWSFIEQPFRTGLLQRSRLPVFASATVLVVGLAWYGHILANFGWFLPPYIPRSAAYQENARTLEDPRDLRWGVCYMEPASFPAAFRPSTCLADVPGHPHDLLLGDSHAAGLYPALRADFPHLNLSQLNIAGCSPTIQHPAWLPADCAPAARYLFDDYLIHHPIDTVLLVARWKPWDLDNLGPTIDWLHQHHVRVILFGPSIEYDQSLVRLIQIARHDRDPGVLLRHRDPLALQLDRKMAVLARNQWHVPYISIVQDLCTASPRPDLEHSAGCPVYGAPGVALLYDTDHLSYAGSHLLVAAIQSRHQLP
jgi:peptidoglycan/LPS O-acetylase OafA/YrhL